VAKRIVVCLVIIAVFVGVYFFVTKGYSGKGINIPQILPTQNSNPTSKTGNGETGSVASTKISLTIISPKDGDILGSTDASVKGKTTPGAEVFVDDQEGKADVNGNFTINIGLDEGQNQIVVLANDADGNAAEQDLSVTVASF
jgi:hypothetical protein